MRPASRSLGVLLDVLYVLLSGLLVIAAAWPIYQNPRAILVGLVGLGIGVLLAAGGRLLRLPWFADLAAAVVLYLVVAVPLAIPSLFPSRLLTGLLDATTGVVDGWKQLVTLDLPLGDYQAVLVPLLVVTLFGAYAATRIAVTAPRAYLLAPLVLVAMFAFGVAFGTAGVAAPYALGFLPALPWLGTVAVYQVLIVAGVLLVLLTLVWLGIRGRRSRRRAVARSAGVAWTSIKVNSASGIALIRRVLLGAGMVVVALGVSAAVAVPALGLDRTVIRSGTAPIQLTAAQASPLSGYRAWFADDAYDKPLFTVAAPADVGRLRLAVMDEYDGNAFAISDPSTGSRVTRLPG